MEMKTSEITTLKSSHNIKTTTQFCSKKKNYNTII